jgi:hypothetical protein
MRWDTLTGSRTGAYNVSFIRKLYAASDKRSYVKGNQWVTDNQQIRNTVLFSISLKT